MRAVLVTRFGGPDVLEVADVERPSPISTEVLVRVLAAGVNPVDYKTRRGDGVAHWMGPPPFVVGWDVCGVVEATGYGVTRFAIGDLVFGMPRFPRAAGAYAEYVTAPSRQFALAPKATSTIEAAAIPLAFLTAWQCLIETAQIRNGQTVLIHGAAGGVGQLAVQIAKAHGARVIATSGRNDREALQARDVDVVLDLVGDDIQLLLDTLGDGGLLLEVAGDSSDELRAQAKKRSVRVLEPLVEPDGRALERATDLIEAGDLKVTVAETFPLERAAAAHERLERGGVGGKLVLEVGHD